MKDRMLKASKIIKPLDIIEEAPLEIIEEEDQSFDETELIDQDGQFIIFAPAEKDDEPE